MQVDALVPTDLQELLGLDAAGAFEAAVVTGGLPRLAQEWRASHASDPMSFVSAQVGRDPDGPVPPAG